MASYCNSFLTLHGKKRKKVHTFCMVPAYWFIGFLTVNSYKVPGGSGDSLVARAKDLWSKGRSGRFFFSRVNFLCWLLFQNRFHPRVTARARKKSWSFCQKFRWLVTAKYVFTLYIYIYIRLCMKWHNMVYGWMVYTEHAKIIIIILIKRCSLTRVKLTALYKHLMTKTTLAYISNKQNLK